MSQGNDKTEPGPNRHFFIVGRDRDSDRHSTVNASKKTMKNEHFPVKHQPCGVQQCLKELGLFLCPRDNVVCRDRSHISRQGKKAPFFLNSVI